MNVFLIEIPLIEIKWIWLQLNVFTTVYDLMHETVIGTFIWAVLKTKFIVRCIQRTNRTIQRKLNEYTFKRE